MTKKYFLRIFLLLAPYVLYGADDTDDASISLTRQTYALLNSTADRTPDLSAYSDLDAIDGDNGDEQTQTSTTLFEPSPLAPYFVPHIITAGSFALSAGLITWAALQQASMEPPKRFEPLSVSSAADIGIEALRGLYATAGGLSAFGIGYWALNKFFTSDLRHKFKDMERQFGEVKQELKQNTVEMKKEVADIKTIVAQLGQANTQVINGIIEQQTRLRKLQAQNPTKELQEIINANDETLEAINNIGTKALRPKERLTPFKWLRKKLHF